MEKPRYGVTLALVLICYAAVSKKCKTKITKLKGSSPFLLEVKNLGTSTVKMLTCIMGWLILVITLSSFQLVKLDSVFVWGGGYVRGGG